VQTDSPWRALSLIFLWFMGRGADLQLVEKLQYIDQWVQIVTPMPDAFLDSFESSCIED
jgi:hypothetical protein